MKKICFLILFLITIRGFAQNTFSKLEDAYEKRSHKSLRKFFIDWEGEIKPITKTELETLPVLQQEIYAIFKSFYNPLIILPLIRENQFNYKKPNYWVLQNQIRYQVIDVFIKDKNNFAIGKNNLKTDTILNFRPVIAPIKKYVYLSAKYEKTFNEFFKRKFNAVNKANSKNNFLAPEITISHGMLKGSDGGYIITFPLIYNIQINSSGAKALVEFQYAYGAAYSMLEKKDGVWILKETIGTLVE